MSEKRLKAFSGGLHLEGHKKLSSETTIRDIPLPEQLILPLNQHIGDQAVPCVKQGEHVLRGQLIAEAASYMSSPVHASTSGTIRAIERRAVPHPSGMIATCIVLDADGKDEAIDLVPETPFNTINQGHLRNIIRHAGIVGLGGAGFPTFIKLISVPGKQIDTLILNGAECEPYISCDDRLMRESPEDIIAGAKILKYITGASRCLIGIEENKPEAIGSLRAVAGDEVQVVKVPTLYPMGGEKQLIHTLTGMEVPKHGLPSDIGIVMQNVATAAAVYQAVEIGEPLHSRVITVTGRGVNNPGNIRVRFGTPFKHVLDACGGTTDEMQRIIMGGTMMGFSINDLDVPVIKTTNCIIAAAKDELVPEVPAMACIRCGACQQACPVDLLPQQLYWFARSKEMTRIQEYNLFDCIECGCCSYVCPSHIPLVSYFRYAKTEIGSKEREKIRADNARVRHEFRDERIEREKRERAEKRAQKKKALANGKAKEQVDKAVQRSQTREKEIIDRVEKND